jgi:hypothetical protein
MSWRSANRCIAVLLRNSFDDITISEGTPVALVVCRIEDGSREQVASTHFISIEDSHEQDRRNRGR